MLTEFEQRIYNTHLAISRSLNNKPFTLRKDFSDFKEDNPNYYIVKKLGMFFNKFPQIDYRDFFTAPYEIYKDDEYYDLKFFISLKAIKIYSMYIKKIQEQSPDSEEQMNSIKRSLKFIIIYCRDHKISIDEYLNYKEPNTSIEIFVDHYKNQKVNLYVLLAIPYFENKIYELDEELRGLFFKEFIEKINSYKIKLYQSLKAKSLIDSYIKQANHFLK